VVDEEEEVSGEDCVFGCVDGRSGCCCGWAGSGIVGGRAIFIESQVEGKGEREGGMFCLWLMRLWIFLLVFFWCFELYL